MSAPSPVAPAPTSPLITVGTQNGCLKIGEKLYVVKLVHNGGDVKTVNLDQQALNEVAEKVQALLNLYGLPKGESLENITFSNKGMKINDSKDVREFKSEDDKKRYDAIYYQLFTQVNSHFKKEEKEEKENAPRRERSQFPPPPIVLEQPKDKS